MSDNSVNFVINVNGNANQTITNIGKSMEGLTGTFARLSAKFALVNQTTSWITGAAQAMQGLVGTSLEFETQQANLKTLLNGDEKAMQGLIGKIQEYGKATVYDRKGLVEAQKTMMAFGMDSEFAFGKLKNIGDIALGDSQKMQSLALAFAQATSSGKLMGQDLMQMINAGFNPLEVIAQKTGKTIGDLKESMSKGEISAEMLAQAFEWATEEGGRFYKGAEEAAQTTAGKIAIMQDTIDEFKVSLFEATNGATAYIAEIGNQLVPFAQLLPLFEGVAKGFSLVSVCAKKAYTNLGFYNGYLSVGKVENLGFAGNVLQATLAVGRFATVGIFNALKALGAYVLSLVTGGAASKKFSTIASTSFAKFALAGKTACMAVSTAIHSIPIIGWVALAVSLISGLLVWAYKKFDKFAAFCSGLWAGIKSLFTGESFSDAYDKAYAEKLAEREKERSKKDNEDAVMNNLIAGANAGLQTTNNTKKPDSLDKKTDATATGGTRNTQITINLGKFMDNMVFNGGFQENQQDIERNFREMLLRTLYSAYNS